MIRRESIGRDQDPDRATATKYVFNIFILIFKIVNFIIQFNFNFACRVKKVKIGLDRSQEIEVVTETGIAARTEIVSRNQSVRTGAGAGAVGETADEKVIVLHFHKIPNSFLT